jgi:hypothetical protein
MFEPPWHRVTVSGRCVGVWAAMTPCYSVWQVCWCLSRHDTVLQSGRCVDVWAAMKPCYNVWQVCWCLSRHDTVLQCLAGVCQCYGGTRRTVKPWRTTRSIWRHSWLVSRRSSAQLSALLTEIFVVFLIPPREMPHYEIWFSQSGAVEDKGLREVLGDMTLCRWANSFSRFEVL